MLERRAPGLAAETELLLYAADRAQHVRERLEPALASGLVVLCDRYTDATVAYQGRGRGLDAGLISELNRIATGGLAPDLTLLLDLPVADGIARKAPDDVTRFEADFDLAYHERVRAGFLALAAAEPGRITVIDATASIERVALAIERAVDARLLAD